jgi:hypothetical protein
VGRNGMQERNCGRSWISEAAEVVLGKLHSQLMDAFTRKYRDGRSKESVSQARLSHCFLSL